MVANKADFPNASVMPYLFFDGRCEEALSFYSTTLGAKIDDIYRFKDSPEPLPAGMLKPGFENKVMHTSFNIRGTTIMASDGMGEKTGFSGFSLSLSVDSETEAKHVFSKLSEGGEIQKPLAKTFYSPCFGMLKDRFGISWMIIVPGEM